MFTLEDLANQLLSCAYGLISIGQFDGWFEDASWNVHRSGNQDLIDAVFEIEGILSDFHSSSLGEDSTRTTLLNLANKMVPVGDLPRIKIDRKRAIPVSISKLRDESFDLGFTGVRKYPASASLSEIAERNLLYREELPLGA